MYPSPFLRAAIAGLVIFAFAQDPLHAAETDSQLPKTHPDWKVELVAEPPTLIHPSVVCCAPDGRVFVAQDPVDMGQPSNEPLDSILCIHPDGKITKFADNLRAVFGLAYVDGKLYVHHVPYFSVFDDDNGVGKNRVDLFQTNPNPTLDGKGFNDHIPSNMRLAMDGYFYMSVGDKGIYNCVGKDGSRVEIHGGGVMRFRPDGTHLEVFATGTRNHLDVALNSEDEIFTYDNTDDGNGWWTRVTHIVDGGYYGYPYDYQHDPTFGVTVPSKETLSAAEKNAPNRPKVRNPKFLPAMTDYGSGSPTASICYNEDALPEEYRGNLFLSEWGRRQLLRLRLSRDGATYKVDERVQKNGGDFLVSGSQEFRPIGIAWSPDGMSLYIADWNFGGWRSPEIKGRLLKVTYTGKSLAAPKPAWFVPAAMGKKFEATDEELLEGLKHPAQSVRMVAQRRLIERGKVELGKPWKEQKIGRTLEEWLGEEKMIAHARWHAIWVLDAINGGIDTNGSSSIGFAAVNSSDVSVASQAIRQLGHLPWNNPVKSHDAREGLKLVSANLWVLSANNGSRVGFQWAATSGRLGEMPELDSLENGDAFFDYSLIVALKRAGQFNVGNRRGRGSMWHSIAELLSESNFVRKKTWFHTLVLQAMADNYAVENVKALAEFVGSKDGTIDAGDVLQVSDIRPNIRAEALLVLAELHRQRPPWDGKWWGTQPVKAPQTPKTVDWEGTPLVLAAITKALSDPALEVRRAAVEGVQIASHKDAAPILREMFARETDPELKKSILLALGSVKDNGAGPLVVGILNEPAKNSALLSVAITSAGQIGDKPCVDALARLAAAALSSKTGATQESGTDSTLSSAIEALGKTHNPDAIAPLISFLKNPGQKVSDESGAALAEIGGDSAFNAVLPLLDNTDPATRSAAIKTAGLLKNKKALPKLLALAKNDATHADAVEALANIRDIKALDIYIAALDDNKLRDGARRAIDSFRDQALPLIEERHRAKPYTGRTLTELQRVYRRDVKGLSGPLYEGKAKPAEVGEYEKFALKNPGDPEKGRKIFEEQAGCVLCHAVDGKGGQIGPDLTGIGTKYARNTLIESVLYPSKQIFDGYRSTIITTKDGDTLTGFIRDETPAGFVLIDAAGEKHPLKKTQVTGRDESNVSLMPEGLHAAFSLSEFANLIGYLESLKEKAAAK